MEQKIKNTQATRGRVIHIFPQEKFTEPFVDFVFRNREYLGQDQHFWIISIHDVVYPVTSRENVNYPNSAASWGRLLCDVIRADKVIFHDLFVLKRPLVALLCLMPWLLNKVVITIWGGDMYGLYETSVARKSWRRLKPFNLGLRWCVRHCYGIGTLIPSDYDFARQHLGAKGHYFEVIYVNPVDVAIPDHATARESRQGEPLNVVVGNSAWPTLNHMEILERLSTYSGENIRVWLPLSYGDKQYAQKVSDYAVSLFGDKARILTDYLSPKEYLEFLAMMDIGIYNPERQVALGNIWALIKLKKKVFLRSDGFLWAFHVTHLSMDMGDCLQIGKMSYESFAKEVDFDMNRDVINKYTSVENMRNSWMTLIMAPR